MSNLRSRAVIQLIRHLLVRAVLVFPFAWTFHYWQAWAFLAVNLVGEGGTELYLYRKDPALLDRRLGQGVRARTEERTSQQKVQTAAQLFGVALMALSLFMVFLVFKTNTYASATVQVEEDQQVVSSGPYALVRHPMYSAVLVSLIGIPLGLGSLWALLPGVVLTAVLAVRLLDEEKFLAKNLAGYPEYMSTVRHRLVPLVW
jgi:hypothetical protein